MPESFSSKFARFKFNLFPAYRGGGGRITYISNDYHEIHVKVPLNLRTRNYVGTIYGGSMYSAVDPILMVMLIKILGKNYIVWDKSASIRFRKPGKGTLFAEFLITPEEINQIKAQLETQNSLDKVYKIELRDKSGTLHAEIEKVLYIARK